MRRLAAAVAGLAMIAAPASAQNPREMLASAAFVARDKNAALAQIEAARKAAEATLARDPDNYEARLQQAIAIGYRAKLKRSPADARIARRGFEALIAANPRDPEAQLALAGWHLLAIVEVGPLLARTVLGARKAAGMASLNRALQLSGGRALFPGYASLTLIQLDPGNVAGARRLAEAAANGRTPTTADRIMQRSAAALLVPLRAGDGKAAAALAETLSPFGRLSS
jgi:hypothetical protein